ncbi:hypothetical protein MKZ38_004771 [Zalerion maritima]|uniref:Chromo domain-containing protein n=1 Tax=Zalerion maritima TaxID=339359 RepID=A0AAD5RRU3_9PEZI|nr:hypothetical protein MKZ38_004771 [Zalerion maritima]
MPNFVAINAPNGGQQRRGETHAANSKLQEEGTESSFETNAKSETNNNNHDISRSRPRISGLASPRKPLPSAPMRRVSTPSKVLARPPQAFGQYPFPPSSSNDTNISTSTPVAILLPAATPVPAVSMSSSPSSPTASGLAPSPSFCPNPSVANHSSSKSKYCDAPSAKKLRPIPKPYTKYKTFPTTGRGSTRSTPSRRSSPAVSEPVEHAETSRSTSPHQPNTAPAARKTSNPIIFKPDPYDLGEEVSDEDRDEHEHRAIEEAIIAEINALGQPSSAHQPRLASPFTQEPSIDEPLRDGDNARPSLSLVPVADMDLPTEPKFVHGVESDPVKLSDQKDSLELEAGTQRSLEGGNVHGEERHELQYAGTQQATSRQDLEPRFEPRSRSQSPVPQLELSGKDIIPESDKDDIGAGIGPEGEAEAKEQESDIRPGTALPDVPLDEEHGDKDSDEQVDDVKKKAEPEPESLSDEPNNNNDELEDKMDLDKPEGETGERSFAPIVYNGIRNDADDGGDDAKDKAEEDEEEIRRPLRPRNPSRKSSGSQKSRIKSKPAIQTIISAHRDPQQRDSFVYKVRYGPTPKHPKGHVKNVLEEELLEQNEEEVYRYWDQTGERWERPDGSWEAFRIIGWRLEAKNRSKVLVHWAGFRPVGEGATWEPEKHMSHNPDIAEMIREYKAQNPPSGLAAKGKKKTNKGGPQTKKVVEQERKTATGGFKRKVEEDLEQQEGAEESKMKGTRRSKRTRRGQKS